MPGRLQGRVALITGAARGQGPAEARLFAAEGATVALADILDTEGDAVAASIDGAAYHHLDVREPDHWQRVVDAILHAHGRLDVLVNNAGVFAAQPLDEMDLNAYRRIIDINQVGVFLGMRAVAPAMKAAARGAIINVSSIDALRGFPNSIAYGASKWAVRGMTRVAARELGPHSIRVNSIHPGAVDTDMLRDVPLVAQGGLKAVEALVPLGRVATVHDVARLVLFLASDDSAYCTGSEFIIDGGMLA